MTTPTLEATNSLPFGIGEEIGTNLLLPNASILSRLEHFPEELYDLRSTSHLSRFIKAMLGDTGVGGLRKRLMISRLQSSLYGTHFFDLDRFYGALFGFSRMAHERYPDNPYVEGKTPDEWEDIHGRDTSYRSRIAQFARALNMGATPDGMVAAAEAVLSVECDLIETYYLVNASPPVQKKSALETRYNYLTNPFGNPTNRLLNWTYTGNSPHTNEYGVVASNFAVARDTGLALPYMLQVKYTDTAVNWSLSYARPASPGQSWTVSAFSQQLGQAFSYCKIQCLNSTGAALSEVRTPRSPTQGRFTRHTLSLVAPLNTTEVRLVLGVDRFTDQTGTVNFVAPMMERTSTPGNYFDGSLGNMGDMGTARWEGVAYNSVSILDPPPYRSYGRVETDFGTYSSMEGALIPASSTPRTYQSIQATITSYRNMEGKTYAELEYNNVPATPGPTLTYADIEGVPQNSYSIGRAHNTSNPGEFIIRPKRSITPEEHYEIIRVLSRIKPAEALLTVNPNGLELHSEVALFNVAADSEHWEIDKVTSPAAPGVSGFDPQKAYTHTTYQLARTYEKLPDYTKDEYIAANRPAWSAHGGDYWTNSHDVSKVLSYNLGTSQLLGARRTSGEDPVPLPPYREFDERGGVVAYLAANALMPMQRILEARSVEDGFLVAAPFLNTRAVSDTPEVIIGDTEVAVP